MSLENVQQPLVLSGFPPQAPPEGSLCKVFRNRRQLHCQCCHARCSAVKFTDTVFFFSLGANIATGEEVAIKLECVKTKHPQLHIESKFYKMMQGGGESLQRHSQEILRYVLYSSL